MIEFIKKVCSNVVSLFNISHDINRLVEINHEFNATLEQHLRVIRKEYDDEYIKKMNRDLTGHNLLLMTLDTKNNIRIINKPMSEYMTKLGSEIVSLEDFCDKYVLKYHIDDKCGLEGIFSFPSPDDKDPNYIVEASTNFFGERKLLLATKTLLRDLSLEVIGVSIVIEVEDDDRCPT